MLRKQAAEALGKSRDTLLARCIQEGEFSALFRSVKQRVIHKSAPTSMWNLLSVLIGRAAGYGSRNQKLFVRAAKSTTSYPRVAAWVTAGLPWPGAVSRQ